MVIEPEGNETITFGSMLAQIRSVAYRLSQEKIAFGDRVPLIGENHPNWAIAYLGIIYRGALVTPLDPAATRRQLSHTLSAFLTTSTMASFLSMLIGISISHYYPQVHLGSIAINLSPGPAIISVATLFFLSSLLRKKN